MSEVSVLFRPATAYQRLAKVEGEAAWKRPLLFAFVLGCVVSLATSGRLTLRLVLPATLYASLIPLVEIAVLCLLLRGRAQVSLRRAVDMFFMGHAAWCVWLIAVGGIFAFTHPLRAFVWTGAPRGWITLALVVIWSAYTDYCFFRCITPQRAGRNLLVQRAFCWSVGLAIFGGGSFWTGLLGLVGR